MNATEQTDAELIAAVLAGRTHDSVAMLVRRHTTRVRAIVHPMLLNHADTDDVTQETLVKVLASLKTFKGESGFATWVHRIAVNTALNFIKRRKRRPPETEDVDAISQFEDVMAARPADKLEAEEIDVAISSAMTQLPLEQRLAISLVAIQGMDEREAASVAGCNTATLRWRLHAARKKLRILLGDLRSHGK